jgi:hypothetical protein
MKFKITLFAALVLLLLAACNEKQTTPRQVFDQRSTTAKETTIRQLRALLKEEPNNWLTRYYLATVLIENASSVRDLREAEDLLEGAENIKQPDWIAAWALLREFQVVALSLQNLQAKGHGLSSEQRAEFVKDPQFRPILGDMLTRVDQALSTIRPLASTSKSQFTADEVKEDLYTLKNLIAARWSYVAEKQQQTGRTLDELLSAALAEVKPRMNRQEAGVVLRRFVSSLLDGHTWLSVDDDLPSRALPFRLAEALDGLIVAETLPDSPVKVGDLLLGVDGQKADTALQEQERLSVGSTIAGRRWNALRWLPARWNGDKPYAVEIERAGQTLTVQTKSIPVPDVPWLSIARQLSYENWVESRMLSPSTGYLRIKTWAPTGGDAAPSNSSTPFNPKHRAQLDAALARVKEADDLVLDLRGNAGGYDQLCAWFASSFVPAPMQTYVLRYRNSDVAPGTDGFGNSERKPATYETRLGSKTKSRLWVLVDSGSFSATDTLLNILTRNIPERVTLIGRPSSGGIGGPASIGQLRNTGASITVSTCKAFAVSGELLEGHPAKVDFPVQWTRADIADGRDPDLAKALELITNRKKSTSSALN